ncbi:hypothetical protein GL325_15105 [Aeromicrobium sp. 636]|uniref:Uncharacterized protein n=1 Tax=Aeromicrobium senzhongii TaxID=2663859 RepID=A0A8I0EWP5_9ACTN|nr:MULTISPECIES: hypothetical protein [Aeromicrobium]MBC9227654.1 hypothetical protein [Aeromicrobium senzhongii]MCQ3999751.1 hypothetical protein [Aeromicrobium sp. 636]
MSDPNPPANRDDADAKAWFYLDHWRDVEEWASLRADAARLLETRLLELGPEVEALGEEFQAATIVSDVESGNFPGYGLHRPEWNAIGYGGVSVVIQWERTKLLKPGSNQWPYVAVQVDGSVKSTALHTLAEGLSDVSKQFGGNRHSSTWPLWEYVEPGDDEKAVSPERLASAALVRLRRLWLAAAPIIDGTQLTLR